MIVRGSVVAHDGRTAKVRVCHGEFCAGCGHHAKEEQQVEIDVLDPVGARPGQRVEFKNDPARMLRTMVLVFWFPLLAAGGGAYGGQQLARALGFAETAVAVAAGVLAFAAAALIVRAVGRRTHAGTGLTITRIIPDDERCANR